MSVALGASAVVGPVGQDRHGGSFVVAEVDVRPSRPLERDY